MIGDRNATGSSNRSAGQNDEQAVTRKGLFEVLAEPSRRRVLRELHETEGRVALHEVADRLVDGPADSLHDGRLDDLGDGHDDRLTSDPDRLAIRLHHSHLPKLDDCGLADYDPESHIVVAEIPAWVEPYLDVVDE